MKTVIANWKMQVNTHEEAKVLCSATIVEATKYESVTTVICPSFLSLPACAALVTEAGKPNIHIGAQNCFWENSGAYTGETSPQLLKDSGVSYVLLGHSERRDLGETDEMINKKVLTTLAVGLIPVLFVGEKEKGDFRQDVLIDQLSQDLAGVSSEDAKKLVLCYEPVWAISSNSGGISDTPENALEALKIIQDIIPRTYNLEPITCLYGGSVNPENAAGFFNAGFAGAVVGSASLDAEKFGAILKIAAR